MSAVVFVAVSKDVNQLKSLHVSDQSRLYCIKTGCLLLHCGPYIA